MRKIAITLLVVTLFALVAVGVQGQGSGNLLRNPSFEGEFAIQDNQSTLIVAKEWQAFFKDGGSLPDWAQPGASAGPIRKPEYKAGTLAVDPRRVRTGVSSQVFFTFYGVLLGGVQQAVPVVKGSSYQAGVFVQAWTSDDDDPCHSKGQMVATVGIDPLGGSDPWARRVIWADWQDANPGCGQWFEVKSPVVVAGSSQVTMYILFQHRWTLKHGDGYVEDAWMRVVPAADCPVPTPCPACPTPTPCPSPSGDCLTKSQFDVGITSMLAQIEVLLKRLTIGLR